MIFIEWFTFLFYNRPVHAYYVIKLKKKIEQDPYEENSELKNQQNAEEDDMFMH